MASSPELVDAETMATWLREASVAVREAKDELTDLDAAIGDADHGANLDRGFTAVHTALNESAHGTPGSVLALAGRTLISSVGGASGPLYGTLLREASKSLGDAEEADGVALLEALEAGTVGVQRIGSAVEGDKTMVDALVPAVAAMRASLRRDESLAAAVRAAADAADAGARATVPLEARRGRASYLGPRSVGHQDPGATSTAVLLAALARTVEPAG